MNISEKSYTVFGKEFNEEGMLALLRIIGNSLNVVAEHGAINQWSPEDIRQATKATAEAIAFGVKSLTDLTKCQTR